MKPLAPLPQYTAPDFSALVRVFDDIRFGPLDNDERYAEFCWFVREFPRIYRHHLDHAKYRLQEILKAFGHHHSEAGKELASLCDPDNFIGSSRMARSCVKHSTFVMYWDFECFLQAVGTALDIVARIAGTAFAEQTSPNFNKFCRKAPESGLRKIFVAAQARWVRKMKAYRDCFTHFTSVDTILAVELTEYQDVWELRAKLPTNPEAREILRFRYRRGVEMTRFTIQTLKNLVAFDRTVAREILRLYRRGEYPKKRMGLFQLGRGNGRPDDE